MAPAGCPTLLVPCLMLNSPSTTTLWDRPSKKDLIQTWVDPWIPFYLYMSVVHLYINIGWRNYPFKVFFLRSTDNYKNSGCRGDIQNHPNQIWSSILGGSQDYRTWTGRYKDKYQRNVNGVLCFCVESKILWVQKNTITIAETANHSMQSNIISGI